MTLYDTNPFGHGSATAKSFLWAIALQPALATVLHVASQWSDRTAVVAKEIDAQS
jgi:hypothetical protein